MCLGEVIIGDVIEALEMLVGRQMVPVNPRGPSISWKMEPSPTWDGGCVMVDAHLCLCICVFPCGCRGCWS